MNSQVHPSRKKITVDQLRLGMFLVELCGAWLDHPFWKTSFLIKDKSEIDKLQRSKIRQVWIDVSRGLDVAAAAAPPPPPPPPEGPSSFRVERNTDNARRS